MDHTGIVFTGLTLASVGLRISREADLCACLGGKAEQEPLGVAGSCCHLAFTYGLEPFPGSCLLECRSSFISATLRGSQGPSCFSNTFKLRQLLLSLARKSARSPGKLSKSSLASAFEADYRQVKNKPLSDIEFRPMQALAHVLGSLLCQISTSSWATTGL